MINKFLKCAIFNSSLIRACFFLATFSLPLETCPNFALFIISYGDSDTNTCLGGFQGQLNGQICLVFDLATLETR